VRKKTPRWCYGSCRTPRPPSAESSNFARSTMPDCTPPEKLWCARRDCSAAPRPSGTAVADAPASNFAARRSCRTPGLLVGSRKADSIGSYFSTTSPSLEIGTVAHETASNATFSLRRLSIASRPVCIIHTTQSRELIKLLQADGWQLQRSRGSHHQFVHPTKPGTVTVPHPKKDLGKGLVRAI
jgi:predicted RNA binding protein YcfA (HicA-like mRNA interferase family)